MGIQREGYQTVQSAGKTQKTCRWHIWSVAVAAEGEQWLLAGGQITGRDASGLPHPPRTLHPSFSSFGSSSLFICLFIIFPLSLACFPSSPFNVLFAFRLRFQMINKIKERVESSWVGIIRAEMRSESRTLSSCSGSLSLAGEKPPRHFISVLQTAICCPQLLLKLQPLSAPG